MRTLIILVFMFIFGSLVQADDKDAGFREHKQKILKEMDEQISDIQASKKCIASASDHEAMNRCREEMEKAHKRHRAEELNSQIQKLQEEKDKLNNGN